MNHFYTFNESMKKDDSSLTASMEDYMEMIYRLSFNTGFVRIHELSQALNVRPSSATKMVQLLAQRGLIKYEKYGFLMLEDAGKKIGARLLERHTMIERFLRIIGVSDLAVLEETEKMEHTISPDTSVCLKTFVDFMTSHSEIVDRYAEYKMGQK